MWLSNLLPNFWVSARRPPPSLAAKSLILGHGNPDSRLLFHGHGSSSPPCHHFHRSALEITFLPARTWASSRQCTASRRRHPRGRHWRTGTHSTPSTPAWARPKPYTDSIPFPTSIPFYKAISELLILGISGGTRTARPEAGGGATPAKEWQLVTASPIFRRQDDLLAILVFCS
jgi:hypothetical protein